MYFDSDMSKLIQRYVGHQVTVQTHGYARIIGTLASVHESCIRLLNAVRLHELDDSRWYGELERSNQQELDGVGEPETLIATHSITSISCEEDVCFLDDIEPPSNEIADNESDDDDDDPTEESHLTLVDPIELRLGVGLIQMVTSELDDRLQRIRSLRNGLRTELGFTTPKVRIRDDMRTECDAYQILVGGIEVAQGQLRPDKILAIRFRQVTCELDGEPTNEPSYGEPAIWIDKESKEAAEVAGYTVVDPWSVLTTHLGEIIRRFAASLLSYQETKQLLELIRERSPCLVADHFADSDSVMRFHRVLQNLLKSGASIVDAERIAVAVAQQPKESEVRSFTSVLLQVRGEVAAAIENSIVDRDNNVCAVSLDHNLVNALQDHADPNVHEQRAHVLEQLEVYVSDVDRRGGRLAVAVDPQQFEFMQQQLGTRRLRWTAVTKSELAAFAKVELLEPPSGLGLESDAEHDGVPVAADAKLSQCGEAGKAVESDSHSKSGDASPTSNDALRLAKPR